MALSGLHVACGYTNGPAGSAPLATAAWSQTMATVGTTAQAAPASNATGLGLGGNVVQAFEVRATADSYVAVGPTPDAVGGPRLFVPGNTTRAVFCNPGDKLAWAAA